MTKPVPELRGPLAMLRVAMITVCSLLSISPVGEVEALYVLFPLAVGALIAYRSVAFASMWPFASAIASAAAVPFTGGGHSPLLPYFLAFGLTLGLTRGVGELLVVSGSTSAILIAAAVVTDVGSTSAYFVGTAEWVVLALAAGLVPIWSRRLHLIAPQPDDYQQVRHLLEQLRSLARHLPGSLDATTAAETLLFRCTRTVVVERAAVIVQTGQDVFVPLAVSGVSRVPWRTPLDADGPLREAWTSGQPARDSRRVDVAGRRRGSTVLALPLPSRQGPFGLVVLESVEIDAFSDAVVASLHELAVAAAPQLETAMMFDEVRVEASSDERDRLAREMHDGIAQELAVLGYQLDQLGVRAQAVDVELARDVSAMRAQVTTVMSELRLSITDLRTSVRPSRGLGAALSTYLPAVCSGREIALNLSLNESPFRLPPELEAALLKTAQMFAQEVRRTAGASSLSVRLAVDPPSAVLLMTTDVPLPDLQISDIRKFISALDGDVTLCEGGSGEPSLTITLKGTDDDNPASRGRSRTDQTRPQASLRRD